MRKDTPSAEVLISEADAPLDGTDTSSEDSQITKLFKPTSIRVDKKNMQMDALIKRIRENEIDLAPSFQRRSDIWTKQVQSRLIESMLIKIPLPAFYMDATDDDRWVIIDGLQRLTTVRRFVIDKNLKLTNLEFLTDYEGKQFDELPRNFQRRIEETDIVVYLIQPGTAKRAKFDIFRRINTGGEPLSPQEMRHALNQGQVTDLLKELAESDEFIQATANGVSVKRMDDRECVLRFLAFSIFSSEKYADDNFDQFLNDRMEELNAESQKNIDRLRQKFFIAMRVAKEIFGNDAFRKRYDEKQTRYPVNKALFETWSVNLSKLNNKEIDLLIKQKEKLKLRFMNELLNNKEFELSISQGTGSIRRVKYRFFTIYKIIKESLDV